MGVRFGHATGAGSWVTYGWGWWLAGKTSRLMWWLLVGWWWWMLAGCVWLTAQAVLVALSLGVLVYAALAGQRGALAWRRVGWGLRMLR